MKRDIITIDRAAIVRWLKAERDREAREGEWHLRSEGSAEHQEQERRMASENAARVEAIVRIEAHVERLRGVKVRR